MSAKSKTTYRVVQLKDGSYSVEVSAADAAPSTVSGFTTEGEAEGWIAQKTGGAGDVNQRAKSIVDRVTRDRD